MKIRTRKGTKIETQMAPMIDVVFQLLIFFMLTLKIIAPEGDFEINMPLEAPSDAATNETPPQTMKVRLLSDPATGELTALVIDGQNYGVGDDAFNRLNRQVRDMEDSITNTGADLEVEIDPDYGLRYEYMMKALSKSSGTVVDGTLVRFPIKVKLGQIRKPAEQP